MLEILLWASVAAVFVGQYALGRLAPRWAGVVPALAWLGAVGYFVSRGQMSDRTDFQAALIGFVVLMVLWGRGLDSRAEKIRTAAAPVDDSAAV